MASLGSRVEMQLGRRCLTYQLYPLGGPLPCSSNIIGIYENPDIILFIPETTITGWGVHLNPIQPYIAPILI